MRREHHTRRWAPNLHKRGVISLVYSHFSNSKFQASNCNCQVWTLWSQCSTSRARTTTAKIWSHTRLQNWKVTKCKKICKSNIKIKTHNFLQLLRRGLTKPSLLQQPALSPCDNSSAESVYACKTTINASKYVQGDPCTYRNELPIGNVSSITNRFLQIWDSRAVDTGRETSSAV